MSDLAPLVRIVSVLRLGDHGARHVVAADEGEREAIARAFDLVAVEAFEADLTLRRWRGGKGVALEGQVRANVVQTCVVTLDPVPAMIDEPLSRRFLGREGAGRSKDGPEEIVIDPDAEDPPDPLDGPEIDLGAIALEHFALALDPYPRAPGASFAGPASDLGPDLDAKSEAPVPSEGRRTPFAGLKDRLEGKG